MSSPPWRPPAPVRPAAPGRRALRVWSLTLPLVALAGGTALSLHRRPAAQASALAMRHKLDWPFSSASIWNAPLGADARRIPAGIQGAGAVGAQEVFFARVGAADPVRTLFAPGERSTDVCATARPVGRIQLPDDLLSPPTPVPRGSPASFLLADGRTLLEVSGFARCLPGGPVNGWPHGREDIYGPGLTGGQGGSGLSGLGGTLRARELLGEAPLRHALKVNLWGHRYLYRDPSGARPCFRWPASRCDAEAASIDPATGYHGRNPALVPGALLAIRDDLTPESLGIRTAPGRTLLRALQGYGAYVVGNAAMDAVLFGVEAGLPEAFEEALGFSFRAGPEGAGAAWWHDVDRLLRALEVIDSNGPNSVGGGGAPLRPLAPPIAD